MFYELLQIAIGNRDRFSQAPTEGEWRELFALAQKQAMVGIAFRGVEQLPGEQRPPKQLLMQWYVVTERIKKMNADLDRKALAVAENFRGEGFPGVVLKGQGIAKLYTLRECAAELQGVGHWPLAVGSRDDDNAAAELQANRPQPKANSQAPFSHTDSTDYTDSFSCQRASQRATCKFTCDFSANAASEDVNQRDSHANLDTITQNTHCFARVGHPEGDGAAEVQANSQAPSANSQTPSAKRPCCHPEENIAQHNDERLTISEANSQQPTANLSIYRTPGDIDIWLFGERKEILDYVRRHVPDCKPVYHHVDFPVVEGLDIEVHFTPSWMNSPVTNRRLQRFFRENCAAELQAVCHWPLAVGSRDDDNAAAELQANSQKLTAKRQAPGANSQELRANGQLLPVPSLAFNRVYILVHIYRHLFAEGIGLRQLLDYYFVLCQGFTEEEREETMRVLRSLKMERFARAVMWVLQAVYGMEERFLLVAPDEREGRFLLDEIMLAGNFGQYDERLQHEQGESALHWGWRKVVRNFRFVRSYPSEVLWSPIFKLWHLFWRKRMTAND